VVSGDDCGIEVGWFVLERKSKDTTGRGASIACGDQRDDVGDARTCRIAGGRPNCHDHGHHGPTCRRLSRGIAREKAEGRPKNYRSFGCISFILF
jgi:hypothetical protein